MKPKFNDYIFQYLSWDYQANLTQYPYFSEAEPSIKDGMITDFIINFNNEMSIYFENSLTTTEIIELCQYAVADGTIKWLVQQLTRHRYIYSSITTY